MKDGQPRTITQIHKDLGVSYTWRTKEIADSFVDEGYLECLGTVAFSQYPRATVFRLAGSKPDQSPVPAVTNNPFVWRTYEQHRPSTQRNHAAA